jgi:hypothetical protein
MHKREKIGFIMNDCRKRTDHEISLFEGRLYYRGIYLYGLRKTKQKYYAKQDC